MINIKWRGIVNGELCIGCELSGAVEIGTDGTFGNQNLFNCPGGKGVLIPTDELKDSCEATTTHVDVVTLSAGSYWALNRNTYFIDPDCICCIESIESLPKHPHLRIKSRVKISNKENKQHGGLCEWIGLINGQEAVGVAMDNDVKGTNGNFNFFRMFTCEIDKGVLVLAENIFHDEPYVKKVIPEESRIFKEIDINSPVKYYYENDTGFQDLFGTVKWTGVDEYGDYYFGLELDDRISIGTDGTFKGERLFVCQSGHGILAPLNRVGRDARFIEKNIPPEKVKMSECCDQIVYGLNSNIIAGENKGIQGNANSCYFDSALFALFVKSDVLDYLFSPMINEHEPDPITKEFRNIVAWKIVYPLRKNGFVSFHHTNEMRNVIQKYGPKFAEMMKQETDMENVSTLLSKLCPNEQLLSIISHNGSKTNSMFMQLFLTIPNKVPFMTSEEMLKISMVQNDIMFNELPTCLIMQAPRDAKGTNSYENALPLKEIEISQICCNYFKKCAKCDNEAKFQCKMCLGNNLDITYTFQCSHHKCTHIECAKLRHDTVNSKSKVFMELQAIICIEKCHFVSFVKQVEKINEKQNDKNNEINWFFFDSMSSQSISNNYAVPKVSKAVIESDFLNSSKKEMENTISLYDPDDIKRIVKDSYIFIYHNKSKTCY